MERINVSDGWRMAKVNSSFRLRFEQPTNKNVATKAVRTAIEGIKDENGYYALWIQDLEDSATEKGFDVHSALLSDEFHCYIPAMCKAIAEALPDCSFDGHACFDALDCLYIDEYDFHYDGRNVYLTESFEDDDGGYFCPECGEWIGTSFEQFDSDEVVCFECEKSVKVSDLKLVPPTVEETCYSIR